MKYLSKLLLLLASTSILSGCEYVKTKQEESLDPAHQTEPISNDENDPKNEEENEHQNENSGDEKARPIIADLTFKLTGKQNLYDWNEENCDYEAFLYFDGVEDDFLDVCDEVLSCLSEDFYYYEEPIILTDENGDFAYCIIISDDCVSLELCVYEEDGNTVIEIYCYSFEFIE